MQSELPLARPGSASEQGRQLLLALTIIEYRAHVRAAPPSRDGNPPPVPPPIRSERMGGGRSHFCTVPHRRAAACLRYAPAGLALRVSAAPSGQKSAAHCAGKLDFGGSVEKCPGAAGASGQCHERAGFSQLCAHLNPCCAPIEHWTLKPAKAGAPVARQGCVGRCPNAPRSHAPNQGAGVEAGEPDGISARATLPLNRQLAALRFSASSNRPLAAISREGRSAPRFQ